MNENENFCKAIEQAVVLPCAKEMQLISDEKCDFSSAYRRRIRRLTKNQDKTPHSLIKTTLQKMIFIIAAMLMIGSITVAAVPPLREWFVGLFASSNDNNTDVWNVHGDVPADDLTDVNQHISQMDLLNRTELKKKLCLSLIILLIMNLSSTLKAVY
jgi:hypothetical protein